MTSAATARADRLESLTLVTGLTLCAVSLTMIVLLLRPASSTDLLAVLTQLDPWGESLLLPLGMTSSRLDGPASKGFVGSCVDLAALAGELLAPRILPAGVVREASTVAYPGLRGVLPGFGLQDPNDWGMGLEIRGTKSPHWTGSANSPVTFGHFGRSGTFLWVDPVARLAVACLTDRPYGAWAGEAWPAFSDAVLAAYQPDEPGSPLTGPTTRDVSQPP